MDFSLSDWQEASVEVTPLPQTFVKFIHIHDKNNPHQGVSIAYWRVYNTSQLSTKCGEDFYEYAIAQCGKKDNFSRKIGRAVASGRLLHGKKTFAVDIPPWEHNPVQVILDHVKAQNKTIVLS